MAWVPSQIFRQFLADAMKNVAPFDLGTDVFKVALYNNSITPDNDVSAANSAYNVGQWATVNEQSHAAGSQWPVGGVALASPTINASVPDVVFWDASDTASLSNATLSNVFGCLVYDDTLISPVADQGVCFNYFGGTNSVVNGTFTVVWHANGIWRMTL